MKIYLLEQIENNDYETYDSCIVCAESVEDAKCITPQGMEFGKYVSSFWAFTKKGITCTELGTANKNLKRGVLNASFNAG